MFDYSSENVNKAHGGRLHRAHSRGAQVDGKEVRSTRVKEEVISSPTSASPLAARTSRPPASTARGRRRPRAAAARRLAGRADGFRRRTHRRPQPRRGEHRARPDRGAVLVRLRAAFFLVYYRMFGLITCIALLINLLMVVAVMSVLGATLTLPGLGGIALTVGMSVDANVLINERIREELRRACRSARSAKATSARRNHRRRQPHRDPRRRRAVRLRHRAGEGLRGLADRVGILTSMYTAVSVSRGIATLIYGHRASSNRSGSDGSIQETLQRLPLRQQHPLHAPALGVAVVRARDRVRAIGAMAFKGFNFALDFTGGTVASSCAFQKPADVDEVRGRWRTPATRTRRCRPSEPRERIRLPGGDEKPPAHKAAASRSADSFEAGQSRVRAQARDFGAQVGKELAENGVSRRSSW